MAGELFSQLEARRLGGDDPMHHSCLFEHDEVSIHRALHEAVADFEDLGQREGAGRVGEHIDDRFALRREPLVHASKTGGDVGAQVGCHDASVPSHSMDPTERFTELVRRAEREVPLDEATLLIAAHHHDVDIPEQLHRLDDIASGAPHAPDALATYLFVERGFIGNTVDYGDPRNSFLDEVLDRRLGLPITLSVLMLEVGRRVGLDLDGVGMPGHFLVGAAAGVFFDPFHGGERLDEGGCRDRFESTQGDAAFVPAFLEPVGSHAILGRILANLVRSFVTRDPANAVWAVRLRLRVPGVSVAERRQAAALLGTLGQFEEAAEALAAIAEQLDGATASRVERDAAAYRARAN